MTTRTNYAAESVLRIQFPDRCERPLRKLKDGTTEELPSVVIYCSGCYRYKRIPPSCGKRNCRRCGLKRSLKLEKKYLDAILSKKNERGKMWSFVNLTGVRVPLDKETLGITLRKFGIVMEKLLSKEYPGAGLSTSEHTTHYRIRPLCEILEEGEFYGFSVQGPATLIHYEPELYIHGHALVYGGFKNKPRFEERWGLALVKAGLLSRNDFERERENAIRAHPNAGYEQVKGLRYVGLELVRNPRASVRYILKYVAKGVELDDTWLEALKRIKYVRTWGFLYGLQEPSFDLICQDCGAKCYATIREQELFEYLNDSGPLRIQRIARTETGPP